MSNRRSSDPATTVAVPPLLAPQYGAIQFPAELPVVQAKADIQAAIRTHQVVIVAGETGSGKTTQLPKMLLELGYGQAHLGRRIAHTQPRRLAARSVAQRIAAELQSAVGERVGFKIRFSDETSAQSQIKLLTDGMLLAELQQDPQLRQYDAIIIDEAHERSLNIDFLLGVMAQLLPRRPELKLIITSATIETERFAKHFNQAPVLTVEGRTFPVQVRYRPLPDDDSQDLLGGVQQAVLELCAEGPGDVLIFASGEREIRDFAEAIQDLQLPDTEVLSLYARLSSAEQNRIFHPHGGRLIVIATNVAETSLTVPGIRYVIDPGTARISRYSYRSKVQRLPIEKISQASANQRMGRCGRVAAGIAIRLYSEEDFAARPAYTEAEILRTNLAAVILQMTAARLGDIRHFPFIDAPDPRFINDGVQLLEELNAVVPSKGRRGQGKIRLTEIGRQLAQLPVDPRLARMILAARDQGAMHEVLVICAGLTIVDPRERPAEAKAKADALHARFHDPDSDFLSLLKLWHYLSELEASVSKSQFRKRLKEEFIHFLRYREWQDVYTQLRQTARSMGFRLNQEAADYAAIHRALLTGMLSHIGQKQLQSHEFLGARQRKFMLFPGSGLFKKPPKWVMAAELVETSRLFARVNARIEPDWVEPLAQHLVKRSYSEPRFDVHTGSVMANEQVSLFGLVVIPKRRVQYGPVAPLAAREVFIREALVAGQLARPLSFMQHNQALLEQLQQLEAQLRRRDLLIDEERLFSLYDAVIPAHIYNQQLLRGWYQQARQGQPQLLCFTAEQLLQQAPPALGDDAYPKNWQQDGLSLPLRYCFDPQAEDDGVSVLIPLPLLNQVVNRGFDWLVPAYLEERVIALIKSLPKSYRRHFVPAPHIARALVERVTEVDVQQPLLTFMSQHLRRMTGVLVPPDVWQPSQVPRHLQMHFVVVNAQGETIDHSDDLSALQQRLSGQVKQALRQAVAVDIAPPSAQDWQFGYLPEVLEQQQQGYAIKAYPALVADKDGVRQAVFERADKAAQAHRRGLQHLLLLQLPSPIKYLQQRLSNKAKLALYFNPWGKVEALIDDCITAALDTLIQQQGEVRDAAQFNALLQVAKAELNTLVTAIAQQLEPLLLLAQNIRKQLKGGMTLALVQAYGDIQSQLEQLIYPGFVTAAGVARLPDIGRYLQALQRRLEKLPVDPNKDRLQMLTLDKLQQAYQQLLIQWPSQQPQPEALLELPWMLQELRVSFFAQQLGTRYPISEKRVLQALQGLGWKP